MDNIFTKAWWLTIAWPLIRTALAGLAPFIPGLVTNWGDTWQMALLTVGLALVVAVAMALASLPDEGGSWLEKAIRRAIRQFGQMVAGATASALVLTDVDLKAVLLTAAGSALATLFLAAMGHGDTPKTTTVNIINPRVN